MAKTKPSKTKSCIDTYCKSKKMLETILADSNQLEKGDNDNVIHQAEQKLEEAFANLLYCKPTGFSDVISKSRLFIDDLLTEAELTQYQTLALQCIIDDLTALGQKLDIPSK